MSEHYSGNDPALGCGLMLVSAAFTVLVVIVAAIADASWLG